MKVIITAPARADLRAIAMHIAKDDPIRAKSFVVELSMRAQELGKFPERFPLAAGAAHLGLRKRTHGNYLILYRVEARQVTVVRVLHASRDYSNEPLVSE